MGLGPRDRKIERTMRACKHGLTTLHEDYTEQQHGLGGFANKSTGIDRLNM